MKLKEMDIIKKLTLILNNINSDDTEWILSNYLLENIHNINELNIMDMSEDCYVSRATIRRFAMKLGYKNFYDLKNQIANTFDYENVSYVKNNSYFYSKKENILEEINKLLNELSIRFNDEIIRDLVEKISKSERIILLSSGKIYGVLRPFQEDFIILEKNTIIKSRLDDKLLFKSITDRDFVLIISSSGKYFELIENDLNKYNFDYIVLTLNMNINKALKIDIKGFDDIKIDMFNKYGITFIFDLILNEYRRKYESINSRRR